MSIALMCRVYGVTRAGYYAWRSRPPSQRDQENENLSSQIRQVHQASRGTYGSPRVYRILQQQGVSVSENRVAKLMNLLGIKGRWATLRYTSPNLKKFYGSLPNQQIGHPARSKPSLGRRYHLSQGGCHLPLSGCGYGSLLKANNWLGFWPTEECCTDPARTQ
ncbi:MAG TPA: IS3 family transposase [Gallionellaceae bacterium]|nr:IS3 family transposase [Gallionellaceae bacterium]